MKLADLTFPISYEVARQYAMVFDASLAVRLGEVWQEHGSTNCVPVPEELIDGRWILGADLLTEIGPGGLLHSMWENVDQEVVFAAVEVIPLADALALLPESPSPVS